MDFTEGYTTPNHNLSSPEHAMLYRLPLGTGFRASELRSLTPDSFFLKKYPQTVTVEASYSKHRWKDIQPIRGDLAALLRPWLTPKPRCERIFRKLPKTTARMLRFDLAAARATWITESCDDSQEHRRREESAFLSYRDHAGRVADFHAVRHTYISGIVAQELARHSTSRLTVDRYAHTRQRDVVAALEALPATTRAEPPSEALAATGTDDATSSAQRMAQRAKRCELLRVETMKPKGLKKTRLTKTSWSQTR